MQRLITVFPTKLCHLYLSPMRYIIMISLSMSLHAGLISQSFSQPNFCTIWQSNLLCTPCSTRTVIYITYLNVFYYTYYPQLFNRTLHTYKVCSYDSITSVLEKITSQHWLITQEKWHINTDLLLHCIYTVQRLQSLYSVNTVQKRVSIYMPFFLCYLPSYYCTYIARLFLFSAWVAA